MKTVITPFRREEIAALAKHYREIYDWVSIDDVAEREGIILIREPASEVAARGYAVTVPKGQRRKRIPSLVRPGTYIISDCEWETVWQACIVINSAHEANEESESEEFVFWHEFYHLGYSPTRNTANFFHSFSTTGILDAHEERRANYFAEKMVGGEGEG